MDAALDLTDRGKIPRERLLAATHSVVAVLTQVINADEKGHQLPVLVEIQRLKGSGQGRCDAL